MGVEEVRDIALDDLVVSKGQSVYERSAKKSMS